MGGKWEKIKMKKGERDGGGGKVKSKYGMEM